MRWLRFAGLILFVAIVQASVLADLSSGPDLLLILLVFFCIYCDPHEAIITSFAIGFAADLIGVAMGPGIISFGVFGTLLACLHRVVALRKPSYQAIVIFVMGIATGILVYLLGFIKAQPKIENIWLWDTSSVG